MAINQFDIAGLFQYAFGIGRGKPYDAGGIREQVAREEVPYDDVPAADDTGAGEFISLDQLIGFNLPTGLRVFLPVQIGGYTLPNEPSVGLKMSKKIVETELVGSERRGTVKELINVNDWEVVIQGLAINYSSKRIYPETVVKDINDLAQRNESLAIECALTRLLGIYRIVIYDVEFPPMIGVQHAQAYQLYCKSDEDFTLTIE